MTAPFRKVGILGGMGVEATIELLRRVHAATAGEDDRDHIPLLVDMNPQVPSRIAHVIEKTGPDPGPVLAEMAQRLEHAGAEALAMPCNTAHLYASDIEHAADIALMNMPQLACAEVAQGLEAGARIGILASPATEGTGLFADYLAAFDLETVYPEESAAILASIRRIKKSGPTQADITLLEQEAAELIRRGAQQIIVGCSEFSLISKDLRAPVPVVDTLDVLVSAIVTFSGAQRKRA